MKRIRRRYLLAALLVVIAAGSAAGVTAANGRSSSAGAGAVARHQTHLKASPSSMSISYQPEGVTLTAIPPGYRPAVSRSGVRGLFHRWPAGPHLTGTPTVKLWTVSDGQPAHGSYPAWVITFKHTRPISYGPASLPQKPDCDRVSIYDLRTHVWTENFQNCPQQAEKRTKETQSGRSNSSCDSGCTPANQPALDAAASEPAKIAGRSYFTGVVVHSDTNTVDVYLDNAPEPVINRLRASRPGIYVIDNTAPNTLSRLLHLKSSLDPFALSKQGIKVVEFGPTADGYLEVGVSSDVATAQAKLDATYGAGIIHVVKSEPVIWGSYPGPHRGH